MIAQMVMMIMTIILEGGMTNNDGASDNIDLIIKDGANDDGDLILLEERTMIRVNNMNNNEADNGGDHRQW